MIIISDFSKTFTTADMPTTWSVFAKSGTLGDVYIHDRNALYEMHYPREIAGDIANTEEWFSQHIELFAKYGLTLEQIDMMVTDDRYFAPRSGVAEFLDAIQEQDISLYIVSSGISIFIERWFALRYDYTPDIIIANEMILENGVVVGVDREAAICPLDKSIELEFEHGEHDIILIGDNTEDTKMVTNPAKTLGFTDEERGFDVKLGREGSMEEVLGYINF